MPEEIQDHGNISDELSYEFTPDMKEIELIENGSGFSILANKAELQKLGQLIPQLLERMGE